MENKLQKILDEHCDWTPKRIEGLKKELLDLFSVSGMLPDEVPNLFVTLAQQIHYLTLLQI